MAVARQIIRAMSVHFSKPKKFLPLNTRFRHSGGIFAAMKPNAIISNLRPQSAIVLFQRHLSNRERRKRMEEQADIEKAKRLKAAVLYFTNPLTWLSNKWNTALVQNNYDGEFTQEEFLEGARQAISYVTVSVAEGRFEQLDGVVYSEAVEWLRGYRASLNREELKVLSLQYDDIAVVKIRDVDMDSDTDVVYVESVCLGLKVIRSVPYLIDLGFRFRRDYSTQPPSDWMLVDVDHISIQDLSP